MSLIAIVIFIISSQNQTPCDSTQRLDRVWIDLCEIIITATEHRIQEHFVLVNTDHSKI